MDLLTGQRGIEPTVLRLHYQQQAALNELCLHWMIMSLVLCTIDPLWMGGCIYFDQ